MGILMSHTPTLPSTHPVNNQIQSQDLNRQSPTAAALSTSFPPQSNLSENHSFQIPTIIQSGVIDSETFASCSPTVQSKILNLGYSLFSPHMLEKLCSLE